MTNVWLLRCLAVLLLFACHREPPLIGLWRTEPRPTQLGMSTDELCLKRDGSFSARASTQAGVLTSAGRYEVRGDRLLFVDRNGRTTATVRIEGDVLTMREGDGKSLVLRYRRQAATCD